MNTKLTLTIEQSVIEKAKKHAIRRGYSLSGIVENYLKAIVKSEVKTDADIAPLTKSLRGTFKAPVDFDYKIELSKGLGKKYLKNG